MSSVIYDNWDPCEGGADAVTQPSGPPCPTGMTFDMNEYCYAVSREPADGQWKIGRVLKPVELRGISSTRVQR